jgi:hypothetical protein
MSDVADRTGTDGSSNLESITTPGVQAQQSDAMSLLAPTSGGAVQNLRCESEAPIFSNPLGENLKPSANDNPPPSASLDGAVKTFWSLDPIEFYKAIVAKIPALATELDANQFTSYNFSVQTLLETTDATNFAVTVSEFLQSRNSFKFRLLESFIVGEIISDSKIPEHYRKYWEEYKLARAMPMPVASPLPAVNFPSASGGLFQTPNVKQKLDFLPETLKLPGLATPVQTPSFYGHLGQASGSMFSLLDHKPAAITPVISSGQDGQVSFAINMLPAITVVHAFPFLEIFSKTTVPAFLRKYKIAKMSAPDGSLKTLKSCINPLLWPNIARIISPTLDVMLFKEKTADAEIYAAMLKKYGAQSADEAMLQLKEIVYKFDDSVTPQDQFAGCLINHFNEVKEQLTQFLYCTFADELTPEAIHLCLKDNFLHNPFIKGPKGESVRQSSNNQFILEKMVLWKKLPISEMMDKIVNVFEEEEASSRRKGYKVVPWVVPKSSEQSVRGGIQKNKSNDRNQNRNSHHNANRSQNDTGRTLCCKCGRHHEPTIETCLLFDHPLAGKDATWPEGKKPLILDDPNEWNNWLVEKAKTYPNLVDKVKKKPQGNHGGGGKPPRHPNNNNNQKPRHANGKFVKHTNCASSQNNFGNVVGGGVHESDGANTGHADHGTDANDGDRLALQAGTRVESPTTDILPIEELIMPVFHAIARFKRGKTKDGKNYPANRRCRTIKTLCDPGSESNFIRAELLESGNLLILDESVDEHRIQVLQNEVPMAGPSGGKCTRAVLLQFTLDLVRKTEVKHTAWFLVSSDVKFDAIVGRRFCKDSALTCFDTVLVPWAKSNDVVSDEEHSLPSKSLNSNKVVHSNSTEQPIFSDEELKQKQAEFDESVKHVPAEMFEKYASKHPVTKRPIIRNPNIKAVEPVERMNTFVSRDNLKIMEHECASFVAKQTLKQRCKVVTAMSTKTTSSDVQKSAEEVEQAAKVMQQLADDAAKFYRDNEHLLSPPGTFVPPRKHARFFEPVAFNASTFNSHRASTTPAEVPSLERAFINNQMVMFKNLQNHANLNGVPARVMSFDEEVGKYIVSVSKPRGFWYVDEKFLQSLEPKKSTMTDWGAKDMGIDLESGQPTLDPLERPAHRQYGAQYSPGLTARINELTKEFAIIFSSDVTEPCGFKPMKIKLKDNAILPRNPRLWKNSPLIRAEVRRQLQKMIDMKIVTKSTTAVVSNVLMVKRPGMPGKFRFTVDFRAVNDATEGQTWQMPDVQDQLSRLKGKKIFGCADASSYYHQILLDKDSRYLTGFVTEDGVWEYARVPMGAKNACAHAQSELQMALDADPVLAKHGIRNYFDDIPIAANTEDEYIEILRALFQLAVAYKLKFNLEKCCFGVNSITHCGFVVSERGVEIDPMRTQSIRELEEPKSIKKVQAVLGTLNYVRHFIKDFSILAKPLTDLLSTKNAKTSRQFCWTQACSDAFYAIRQAALDAPLLEIIDYTKDIFIRSDSSQFGQGAVLFQYDSDGKEHVVAYASRKYSLAERNWATFQQEASAIVWSLEKFSEFIGGHKVIVQTDHKNLAWISKSIMPQLTRWRLRLQDFDFHVEFIPGRLNEVSDGLSRSHVDDTDIPISMRDFLPSAAAAASLLHDSVPMCCLNNYRAGKVKSGEPSKTATEIVWEGKAVDMAGDDNGELTEERDLRELHRDPVLDEIFRNEEDAVAGLEVDQDSDDDEDTDAVPVRIPDVAEHESRAQQTPKEIIATAHGDIIGHGGCYVTLQRILKHKRDWASRTQMLADIDAFISGCPTCQKFKKRHDRSTDQRFFIEGSPFGEISVDILNLPAPDCYGNAYIVTIVDTFTRFLFAVPVPDKTAINAGRAILQSIGIFGAPITIRSDGGGEFVADVIKSIEVMTDIKHHRIQPYIHTGNSIAERTNRSILEHMRTLIWDKRLLFNGEHMWSDVLPLACRIINSSFNSSIGCSPASLLFGDNVDMDRCILSSPPKVNRSNSYDYTSQLSQNQRTLLETSEEYQDKVHAKALAKWRLDHKGKDQLIGLLEQCASPQNTVTTWVVAKVPDDAPHNKLKPRWSGPYVLMGFKNDSLSMLRLWDTVSKKVREAPLNSVAVWNSSFDDSAESMSRVRESDYADLAYPMEAILGVALDTKDPDVNPVPLPANHVRTQPKSNYVFSIKWRGYHEPTWRPFRVVKSTSLFPLFAASRPDLNM